MSSSILHRIPTIVSGAVLAAVLAIVAAGTAQASAPVAGAAAVSGPLATLASGGPTVTNPQTGEQVKVTVFKKKFETKRAATKQSKRLALRSVQRTGWWSWGWHVVRCGGGAWGGFWASWWLPPWVRVGSMVAGCIVAI